MATISYLSFVSVLLIPFQVILLILLTLGVARRQVFFLIQKVIEAEFTINGFKIKLFPFLAVISAFCVATFYLKIGEIEERKKADTHLDQSQGEYQKVLY